MNQKQINSILQEHGIEIETVKGNLMVLDCWIDHKTSEAHQMWVNAPNTKARLDEFLGYTEY